MAADPGVMIQILLVDDDPGDVLITREAFAENLHANAFVTKPVDFDRFLTVVRQIGEFFVSGVKLPSR